MGTGREKDGQGNGEQSRALAEVVDLMPWDIAVRSANARRHASEMIERADADQAIRALTELEAYYAIKALGPDDAAPYLAVIEPDAIRALIDLDVWEGDKVRLEDILVWLGAFREVGLERAQAAARALDRELLALLFRRRLLIAARVREEEEQELPGWARNPPEEILPLIQTPDRRFLIAARARDEISELSGSSDEIDEEERKSILELIDALYRAEDHDLVVGALRLAETDLSFELEETAYHFRRARLEDLGFPPIERAVEVYSPIDPARVLTGEVPEVVRDRPPIEMRLPALHASRLSEGLLRAALREIQDPERVRTIESEVVPLANAVLVADRVEPGDLDRIGDTLDRVRALIELALAAGVSADRRVEVARQRLETIPIRDLFRAGYSITLELATRARALARRGAFKVLGSELGLLEEGDRSVIEALLARRPLFSTALVGEGPDGGRPKRVAPETRPFRGPEDVERTREALNELEVLAAISERLQLSALNEGLPRGIDPPLAERTIDVLLATIASNLLLAREPGSIEPVSAAELAALAGRFFQGGRLAEPELARIAGELAKHVGLTAPAEQRAVARRLSKALEELGESLAPLAGKAEIDPRFVGGVLRSL